MTAPLALADLLETLALYADAWAVIVVDDAPEVEADVKLARARAASLREMEAVAWRCIKTRTGVESKQHESPRSLKYCEDHWTSQTHIPLFELPDLPEKEVPK